MLGSAIGKGDGDAGYLYFVKKREERRFDEQKLKGMVQGFFRVCP
jgi:hypothetical protein